MRRGWYATLTRVRPERYAVASSKRTSSVAVRCLSCRRSRPSGARRAGARGAAARARRDPRSAADAAGRSARRRRRTDGRARRAGRPARQVPDRPFRVRARAPDPPPDDGQPAARARRGARMCVRCSARRRHRGRLPRRAPLRHVAPPRARASSTRTWARASGAEPLVAAFTARGLGERLDGRRAPLKAALLDQRTLAGLGNIYVDEALWYATPPSAAAGRGARPRRAAPACTARSAGARARDRAPGLDATDYRLPDGSSGSMQNGVQGLRPRRASRATAAARAIAKTRVGGRGHLVLPALPAALTQTPRKRVIPATSCIAN